MENASGSDVTSALYAQKSSSTSIEQDEYTLIRTGKSRRHAGTRQASSDVHEEEPINDTTAPLILVSRKTKRLEQQQLRKQKKRSAKTFSTFLDLPSEIVLDIFGWLRPSNIYRLLRLTRGTRNYILSNEKYIAERIIDRRYHVLGRCFPLPFSTKQLPSATLQVLLNPRRQKMLGLIKNPYQHIRPPDVSKICSCTWCIFCWNNLCLVLDFYHFQPNLDNRIPIPIIPRGSITAWNEDLIQGNAARIEKAMSSPLTYASILEKHLYSIIGTITRKHLLPKQIKSGSGKLVDSKVQILVPVYHTRPYGLTDAEARLENDAFLERKGRPSYELPFQRDNYYALEAYVPNRKWSNEEERWVYYAGTQHDNDVALAMKWFGPKPEEMQVVESENKASIETRKT